MISVIIPVFNHHDMTNECIYAVMENTQDCEIIIIDNGSTPEYSPPFTGFIECRCIRNAENKGFPAAINQGIREASGDVIILLNNDVIVTPWWTERLIPALDHVSIVGPVTNYSAGLQKIATDLYNDKDELSKVAGGIYEDHEDSIQEVNWVIGFCMVFKKSLVDEIGYFDESIWPCCGEEIDFCLRAKKAGHKIGIAQGCYLHHDGSATFRAMDDLDYKNICLKNEKHLESKWGKDWYKQEINASPTPQGLCLNLGCGYKHLAGFINVDNRPEVSPDLCCDVIYGMPYADNTVDMVRADDFLEHIPIGKVIPVMNEIYRVLKPGGVFESSTPSTDGRGAFQDPTHQSFWNRNSWSYYSDPSCRRLYDIDADFEIVSIDENDPDPDLMIIHTHVIAKKR